MSHIICDMRSVFCQKPAAEQCTEAEEGSWSMILILLSACQIYCNWETINSCSPIWYYGTSWMLWIKYCLCCPVTQHSGFWLLGCGWIRLAPLAFQSNKSSVSRFRARARNEWLCCAHRFISIAYESINFPPWARCFSLLTVCDQTTSIQMKRLPDDLGFWAIFKSASCISNSNLVWACRPKKKKI